MFGRHRDLPTAQSHLWLIWFKLRAEKTNLFAHRWSCSQHTRDYQTSWPKCMYEWFQSAHFWNRKWSISRTYQGGSVCSWNWNLFIFLWPWKDRGDSHSSALKKLLTYTQDHQNLSNLRTIWADLSNQWPRIFKSYLKATNLEKFYRVQFCFSHQEARKFETT